MTAELNSVFGTYHVRYTEDEPEILEILSAADERPYGPVLKLNLEFPIIVNDIDIDPGFIKEVLKRYKDKITGLKIPYNHDGYEYLLEQDFDFQQLEKLNLQIFCCFDTNCLVRSLICRHANKLQHIGIDYASIYREDDFVINHIEMPCIPNLNSLALKESDKANILRVMRTVNFKNITSLKLEDIKLTNMDIKDFNIQNLSVLSLRDVNEELALSLMKTSTTTLTKLIIAEVEFNNNDDLNCLKFDNLKYLELDDLSETISLTLVKTSMHTLRELNLPFFTKDPLETYHVLKLPYLKKIHFDSLHSKLTCSIIYACDEKNTKILYKEKDVCDTLIDELRTRAWSSLWLFPTLEKAKADRINRQIN